MTIPEEEAPPPPKKKKKKACSDYEGPYIMLPRLAGVCIFWTGLYLQVFRWLQVGMFPLMLTVLIRDENRGIL